MSREAKSEQPNKLTIKDKIMDEARVTEKIHNINHPNPKNDREQNSYVNVKDAEMESEENSEQPSVLTNKHKSMDESCVVTIEKINNNNHPNPKTDLKDINMTIEERSDQPSELKIKDNSRDKSCVVIIEKINNINHPFLETDVERNRKTELKSSEVKGFVKKHQSEIKKNEKISGKNVKIINIDPESNERNKRNTTTLSVHVLGEESKLEELTKEFDFDMENDCDIINKEVSNQKRNEQNSTEVNNMGNVKIITEKDPMQNTNVNKNNKLKELIMQLHIDEETVEETEEIDQVEETEEIDQCMKKQISLNNTNSGLNVVFNSETKTFEIFAREKEINKDNTLCKNNVVALELPEFDKCNTHKEADVPLASFNVTFDANTDKYEIAQVQLSMDGSDNDNTMETLEKNSFPESEQLGLNSAYSDNDNTNLESTLKLSENCIISPNKEPNCDIHGNDGTLFAKPHNMNEKSKTSADDISLKGLIDLYSDEVREEMDSEKPVIWPPPCLEDSHLDLLEQESKFYCSKCDKHFSTECDMSEHYCSTSYTRDFSAFNKILKKRKRKNPDPFNCKLDEEETQVSKPKTRAPRFGVDLGPYPCPICKKSISRRSGLKIHIRRHNKDMPYKCEYCKKQFVVLYDLDRHTVIKHVREKRYRLMCEICTKPFYSKDGLMTHKKEAHRGYPSYVCEICNMQFDEEYRLWRHQKTQHEHGDEIKQSNVIEQSLEILDEIDKPQTKNVASMKPKVYNRSSTVTQIDDTNMDKDPIELVGLNPLDIDLVELNSSDIFNATSDTNNNETEAIASNDIEVEMIDLKHTLMDDSMALSSVSEVQTGNKTDIDPIDINENLLNEMFDLAESNKSNGASGQINVHSTNVEEKNANDVILDGVHIVNNEMVLNSADPKADSNGIGQQVLYESRLLGESIQLMETDLNVTPTVIIPAINQVPNMPVQLVSLAQPCILNSAIRFVNPVQLQNPPVGVLDVNQPNVLLLRF